MYENFKKFTMLEDQPTTASDSTGTQTEKTRNDIMRIEIKTKGPIKDNDIKALYLIRKALELSSPHMKKVNLDFAWESYSAKLGK